MQKLFIKVFGAARMKYSTISDKFETTYHKPGGTACGALGKWFTEWLIQAVMILDMVDGCISPLLQKKERK
jgi:hypothetical protein